MLELLEKLQNQTPTNGQNPDEKRLERVKEILHHQLDSFSDEEIINGISIAVSFSDDVRSSYGLDTDGQTPAEVMAEIDAATRLFDLHFEYESDIVVED